MSDVSQEPDVPKKQFTCMRVHHHSSTRVMYIRLLTRIIKGYLEIHNSLNHFDFQFQQPIVDQVHLHLRRSTERNFLPGKHASCKDQAPLAYTRVHSLAVSTASASLAFQCFATLSASGSSGFGALSNAWMLNKTVRI